MPATSVSLLSSMKRKKVNCFDVVEVGGDGRCVASHGLRACDGWWKKRAFGTMEGGEATACDCDCSEWWCTRQWTLV